MSEENSGSSPHRHEVPEENVAAAEDRRTGDERRSGMDRRSGVERRTPDKPAAPPSALDRRRGPGRRRTDYRRDAEEGHMNEEQLEFIKCIDRYKRVQGRPFPTWTELLKLAWNLGYRKVAPLGEFKLTKGRQTGAKSPPKQAASSTDRRRRVRRTRDAAAAGGQTAERPGGSEQDQIAFIHAIEEYKRVNGRPFPTWTEVLDVILYLGYRRVGQPDE